MKTLAREVFAPGEFTRTWDGTTDGGGRAASGNDLARLSSGSGQDVVKLNLVK